LPYFQAFREAGDWGRWEREAGDLGGGKGKRRKGEVAGGKRREGSDGREKWREGRVELGFGPGWGKLVKRAGPMAGVK